MRNECCLINGGSGIEGGEGGGRSPPTEGQATPQHKSYIRKDGQTTLRIKTEHNTRPDLEFVKQYLEGGGRHMHRQGKTTLTNRRALCYKSSCPAGGRSPFRGHPIGDPDGADPAGLRADDVALPAVALIDEVVKHELGHLRGLSAPRLATQNYHLPAAPRTAQNKMKI